MAAEPLPDYLIAPAPGYAPSIGRLAYVRATTLEAVEGLTQPELDHLLDEDANSIAMLLEHIPSVEEYCQRNSLGLTTPAATSERTRLGASLGDEARQRVRGQPLGYYLGRMRALRAAPWKRSRSATTPGSTRSTPSATESSPTTTGSGSTSWRTSSRTAGRSCSSGSDCHQGPLTSTSSPRTGTEAIYQR